MAAAEPAPAAVMTWARGSTTLPAAQTPLTLVRPVASTLPAWEWDPEHLRPPGREDDRPDGPTAFLSRHREYRSSFAKGGQIMSDRWDTVAA
jgi:hypothetical protein